MVRRSRSIPLPEPASLTNSLKIYERCRLVAFGDEVLAADVTVARRFVRAERTGRSVREGGHLGEASHGRLGEATLSWAKTSPYKYSDLSPGVPSAIFETRFWTGVIQTGTVRVHSSPEVP